MSDLKGKRAIIAVDYLADKELYQKDLVEILNEWEEPLFAEEPRLGKKTKLKVRSLERSGVETDIDLTDVVIRKEPVEKKDFRSRRLSKKYKKVEKKRRSRAVKGRRSLKAPKPTSAISRRSLKSR